MVASAEDASRLRDALGVSLPVGLPAAFTDPVADPLADLLSRYARTHGPFLTAEVGSALALNPARVERGLRALEQEGRIVRGEFRPEGSEREWCHREVLKVLRRRSLAARGCDEYQGYLFSRPLTTTGFARYLGQASTLVA